MSSSSPVWLLLTSLSVYLTQLLGTVPEKDTGEGNRLFQDGKLDDALKSYTQAQVGHPDAPELHYDIGNVQYRKKDSEKALEEYRTVAAGKTEVARRASFNLGNLHYQAKKWKEAVDAYSAALRIDPGDVEARQNLELALQKLKEEEQKKQQEKQKQNQPEGGGQGQGQKEQSPDKKENQKPKDDLQQNEQNPEPKPDTAQGPKPDESKANPAGADSQMQSMTPEQAEQILQALAQIEQAQQMQQQKKQKAKAKGKGKTW
jgi:Ca-activated chloride channel homolog